MKNNISIIFVEEFTSLFMQILMIWLVCFFLSVVATVGVPDSKFFIRTAKYAYAAATTFAILRTIYRILIKKE